MTPRRDGSVVRDGAVARDGGGPGTPCVDEGHSALCATPTDLGPVMVGEEVLSEIGVLPARDDEDWLSASFPPLNMPSMFGGGMPQIELAMNEGDQFRIEVRSTCAATLSCGSGGSGARDIGEWSFTDDQLPDGGMPDGASLYQTRDVPWPDRVSVRVYRPTGTASCGRYQLRVSR